MNKASDPNERIWDELARKGVLCSQPKLHLTPEAAMQYINARGLCNENFEGKNILCLACGGGQQSIAFALLGANVTVVDFSEEQLEKDRLVAKGYQKQMRIVKSDMRELSFFEDQEFDQKENFL